MIKKGLTAGLVLICILIIAFTLGDFKTGKVIFESINQQENNQASEILLGKVLNIVEISSTECLENKVMEFEIKSVQKSNNNLKIGDKINIALIVFHRPTMNFPRSPDSLSSFS